MKTKKGQGIKSCFPQNTSQSSIILAFYGDIEVLGFPAPVPWIFYSIVYSTPALLRIIVGDAHCTLHTAQPTSYHIPLHCISYTYFTVSKMQSLPIPCSIKSIYIYKNVMLLGQLYKSRTRSSWHDTPSMDANSIVANECKWTHQDHLYLFLLEHVTD